MFLKCPLRLGVHATIPLYVDVVRTRQILANGIEMVITAEQSTEIQCAVAIALQEILALSAQNGVETNELVSFNELANRLILTASNGADSRIHVSADMVERLAMTLSNYQAAPDLFINEARDAVLRNNLIIEARDGTEICPTIKIEAENGFVLTVANGIEIPITRFLNNIRNVMEFDLQSRMVKIGYLDTLQLEDPDGQKIYDRAKIPFDLALDIGLFEDDSGMLNLALYARDGVETISAPPMIIGTIDPKKLSELDPYFIPDYEE